MRSPWTYSLFNFAVLQGAYLGGWLICIWLLHRKPSVPVAYLLIVPNFDKIVKGCFCLLVFLPVLQSERIQLLRLGFFCRCFASLLKSLPSVNGTYSVVFTRPKTFRIEQQNNVRWVYQNQEITGSTSGEVWTLREAVKILKWHSSYPAGTYR